MSDGLGILLAVVGVLAPLVLAWFLVARDAPRSDASRTIRKRQQRTNNPTNRE